MKKSGFTLIELIIVMAILAVLASIGVSAFTTTQKKSRDSGRKANLKAIATALEYYYNDKGKYPPDDGSGGMKGCGSDANPFVCPSNTAFQDANDTIYMQIYPTDPVPKQRYYYHSPATNQYEIYAHIENPEDPAIISTSYSCATSGSAPCNYAVSSANIVP